jgi:hypothetical protein
MGYIPRGTERGQNMNIVMLINMPISIPLRYDALDKRYNIDLGDHKSLLIFPGIVEIEPDELDPVIFEPDRFRLFISDELANPVRVDKQVSCGSVYSNSDGLAFVNKVMIKTKISEEELEPFLIKLDDWFDSFMNYFRIDASLSSTSIRVKELRDNSIKFAIFSDKNNWQKFGETTQITIEFEVLPFELFKYEIEIKEIIEKVASSRIQQTEYKIYLESIAAFNKDEYRRAIIEAATCIELTLTMAITNQLEFLALTESNIKSELKKHPMLGKRIELCKKYNVLLPDIDFENDILVLRNNVLHIGYKPKEEEAKRIINHAKHLLDVFMPL